jgi:hypothetical protein
MQHELKTLQRDLGIAFVFVTHHRCRVGRRRSQRRYVARPAHDQRHRRNLEIIVDTGDFELEYTDAFINAKG